MLPSDKPQFGGKGLLQVNKEIQNLKLIMVSVSILTILDALSLSIYSTVIILVTIPNPL